MLIEGRSDTTDRLVNVILSVLPLGRPLCSIMFDKADATISATATDALESLRKKLGTGSVPRLRIIGYADGSGTDLANDRLSLARARAVAEQATILVPAGDLRHITFEGRGVERVEGRGAVHDAPQSRRVDVYVAP